MTEKYKELNKELRQYLYAAGFEMTDVIKELLKRQNKELTEKNIKNELSNLSNKLRKGTIRYNEMLEIAEISGYSLKWEKRV